MEILKRRTKYIVFILILSCFLTNHNCLIKIDEDDSKIRDKTNYSKNKDYNYEGYKYQNSESKILKFLNTNIEMMEEYYRDFKYMIKEVYSFIYKKKYKISNNKKDYLNYSGDYNQNLNLKDENPGSNKVNNNKRSIFHRDDRQISLKKNPFLQKSIEDLRYLSQVNKNQSSKLNISIYDTQYDNCSGKGNKINLNYTNFICKNKTVKKSEYSEYAKNETLFSLLNCTTEILNGDVCICPKNYRGVYCELEVPIECKIISLFAKNNTQDKKVDLLENKNTFYFEYYNNPKTYYLDRKKVENFISFEIKINCSDISSLDYNYTVTFGELKQEQIEYNLSKNLEIHPELTSFKYFLLTKQLTLSTPVDLYLRFKIYNMNDLLPYITLYYPFTIKGNHTRIFYHDNIVKQNDYIKNNKSNDYSLLILNSDSIRNFICENYHCEDKDTIEEIITKNYKDKTYYTNFANNLLDHLHRKSSYTNEYNIYVDQILKGGMKFSSIDLQDKINRLKNINKVLGDDVQQKYFENTKNFLIGRESFEINVNLNQLNQQLIELKNEEELFSFVKGGKIFYEIDIVDDINDMISDCMFQGDIIVDNDFPEKTNWGLIVIIVTLVSLLIIALIGIYVFKRGKYLKYE